ncbi:MAG: SLBB domain-containing protein [Thermodesulfobacteriota bacterium]|nr:SLBB domain-containing protein [Thermodesulfobacteriota bacterium]
MAFLRNRFFISLLFISVLLSLFCMDNGPVCAQDIQTIREKSILKEKSRQKITEPVDEEALDQPIIPAEDFRFLTDLFAVPGDSFVDLDWTPFWKDDLMKPSKVKEFKRLLEKKVDEVLLLREKEEAMPQFEAEEEPLIAEVEKEREEVEKETLESIREGEEIAGYIIYYGEESFNYIHKVDVGNVTRYRMRRLNNHTTYFFAVQAYTKLREFSELSYEVHATPKPEDELMSEIEKGFAQEKIPQKISRKIKQFGYDFFHSTKVPGFAPLADALVGSDYIIGPGDSFTVSIWGRIDATFSLGVDRNGEITIPKVGVIKVWGLTFKELKETIHHELSKYYSGFRMNITMDRLRTIRVFLVGEAMTPGSYTFSSISTVYSALISAGGPSKKGSMRNIQLIRNGNLIKTIDLYDFLIKGDKSQDERLQSGDTIFIPVIGQVAGITGNVKRPAIYELNNVIKLEELINLAGGVTFMGYLQRIQVERIIGHHKKVIVDFDVSYDSQKEDLNTVLRDGDMVKVFPIFSKTRNIVYLEGHVKRPGGYEFKEGMKLLDVISSFDDLLPEPYLYYADITRLVPPDLHPEVRSFNLEKLLSKDPSQNIELKEYDKITIYSKESLETVPHVTVAGEVQSPGKYQLFKNMKVRDLIYAAGNLKRSAYMPEAEVTRLVKDDKSVVSRTIKIDLGEVLKGNSEHNFVLLEDDYLFVRQIPKWYTDKTVKLKGEVKFPGVYAFSKGMRLSSVLERAGGFTEYSYLKGGFFTRKSAKKIQEERLRGFIDRLEEDILSTQARSAEAAISEKEIKGLEQSLKAKEQLLEKLSKARVTGRVVIVLDTLDKFKGSKYDLELEDGDTLTIPPMPGIVNVLGSVYNPTSIVYTKGKTVHFYLNKVGGATQDADEGNIYVIKADGTVVSKTQKSTFGLSWDSDGKRWLSGGFMSTRIDPGDTILVPSRVTQFVWKREIMEWTQILYQIAVSAGVLIAAF